MLEESLIPRDVKPSRAKISILYVTRFLRQEKVDISILLTLSLESKAASRLKISCPPIRRGHFYSLFS